jgi:2-hydroxycyclohexanecarboxyl-CoA dehydrogenase
VTTEDPLVVVVGTHTPVGARIAERLTARGATVVDLDGAAGSRTPVAAVLHAEVDPALYEDTRLDDLTPERWQERCARPIDAALRTAWAAFELMATGEGRPGRGGVLGFVCPTVAMTGAAGQVAASTTGEAIRLLAKSAARRWGRFGVTSNAFALRLDDPRPAGLQVHAAALAADDLDPADDVASLLLYLASPTAARLTGATFTADGGELMTP